LVIKRAETVAPYFDESKYAQFCVLRMSISWVRRMALCIGLAVAASATQLPARAEKTIEISLKDRYLKLLDSGVVVARYPVAIGAPESPTPAGSYEITRMEDAPVYHKKGKVIAPGPKNPVGVRYMAYFQLGSGEYAIHGTAWPNWVNLRAAVSLGCIRMLNKDVISLFNQVDVGTPVVVTSK
jgi:lipoprotein-anchoring transpeptidase ErfK/SrfK